MIEKSNALYLPYNSEDIFGRWAYRGGIIEEITQAVGGKYTDLWHEGTEYKILQSRMKRDEVLEKLVTEMAQGSFPHAFNRIHSVRTEKLYVPFLIIGKAKLFALNNSIRTVGINMLSDDGMLSVSDVIGMESLASFSPELLTQEDKVLGMDVSMHDAELIAKDLDATISNTPIVVMVPVWRVAFVAYDGTHMFYLVDGLTTDGQKKCLIPNMPIDEKLQLKQIKRPKLFEALLPVLMFIIHTLLVVGLKDFKGEVNWMNNCLVLIVGAVFCCALYVVGAIIDWIIMKIKNKALELEWKHYCEASWQRKQEESKKAFGVALTEKI